MIIYKIQNKINDKIYIGQTINAIENRFYSHVYLAEKKEMNTPLYRSIRKHGSQSFDISIVDYAVSKESLNEKEKYWIKFFDCKTPNGYNISDGGNGGNLGEIVNNKIRETLMGRKIPQEVIEKRKISMKKGYENGTHIPWQQGFTKETHPSLKAMSESIIKDFQDGKRIAPKGEKSHHYGKHSWNAGLTKETNERVKKNGKSISKSLQGNIPWNKNLTKEIDERLKMAGEKQKITKTKKKEEIQ